MEIGTYAKAILDFQSTLPGELPLHVGDVVRIDKIIDSNWLHGSKLGGINGIFPVTFVKRLEIPKLLPDQLLLIALNTFAPQQSGDLGFLKGDAIVGVRKVDENWLEGEIHGKRGIFPSNFVREVPVPKTVVLFNTANINVVEKRFSNGNKSAGVQAVVKANLDAKLPEEISLRKGEIVYVEEFLDKNWCKGYTTDGRKGIFPKGFVEIGGERSISPHKPPNVVGTVPTNVLAVNSAPHVSLVNKLPSPVVNYTSAVTNATIASPTTSQAVITDFAKTNRDDIQPYGRTKYPFSAEYSEELSLQANQIVKLVKHIDDEWTLGELNGKKGIFPTTYIDIIVDCHSSADKKRLSIAQSDQNRPCYVVIYDFVGTVEGDLNARVNDIVQVIKHVNDSWIEGFNCRSNCRGLIPVNFLKPVENAADYDVTMRNVDKRGFLNERPHSLDDSIANNIAHLEQQPFNSLNVDVITPKSNAMHNVHASDVSGMSPNKKLSSPPARPTMSPALNKPIQEDLEQQKRKKEEEKKMEVRAQRIRIFQEILNTERDYITDLTVCQEVLSSYRNALDVDILLAGLPSIVLLSKQLVHQLETEFAKDFVYQEIGTPYLSLQNEFKQVYGGFCETHEDAQILLDKYETEPPKQIVLKDCLAKIQQRTTCMDLSSCLSRPIQRVLKYPLFLAEVLKCTENNQSDKVKLMMALKVMTEVAQCINETKRRKDLVTKYRKDGESNFSDRLSRLNMHTFRKKSSRFSVRLQTSIGLTQCVKDEEFDEIEKQFKIVEKTCRLLVRDVQAYCEQMLVYFNQQMSIAEGFHHGVGAKSPKTEQYFEAWSRILFGDATLQRFFDKISEKVRTPVSTIQQYCKSPEKLILKRRDKLLDFEGASSRYEKEKSKGDSADPARLRTLEEEFRISKMEYEAMNTQLKTELPHLCNLAYEILSMASKAFIAAQRSWVYDLGRQFQPLERVVNNVNMLSADAVVEQFTHKHQIVLTELTKLTFATNTVGIPASGRSPNLSRKPTLTIEHGNVKKNNQIVFPQKPQSETDRQILITKYDELYCCTSNYQPQSELDILLKNGDLIGVIVNKDPMGNSDRWFVDNGVGKGFVPRNILKKYEFQNNVNVDRPPPVAANGASKSSINKPAQTVVNSYNERPVILRENKREEQPEISKPRPSSTITASYNRPMVRSATLLDQKRKAKEPLRPKLTPERPAPSAPSASAPLQPVRSAPPPPKMLLQKQSAPIPCSVNSEDEYTSVVKNSQNQQKSSTTNFADEEPIEFYVVLYDFPSRCDNELKVSEGQVVAVHAKQDLENNDDWWLVENEEGEIGYVPSNYLKIYSDK